MPRSTFSVPPISAQQPTQKSSPALGLSTISEARWKGYKRLRITTGAENNAMRALAKKFGAHLAFRHGESTGTIDLTKTPEAELAELAAAPFRAGRALLSFNSTCWKLISSMYGNRAA